MQENLENLVRVVFSLNLNAVKLIKDVLYSMLGPDLLGLTVAVRNIVG